MNRTRRRSVPPWVLIAICVPIAAAGVYFRFASLPDVFCKQDELAEVMPGLRLHAMPFASILNLRDGVRYNLIQSMFYSQHGLGDVSFSYLASSVLSVLGLPISERHLFAIAGVTNLGLIVAGAVFTGRLLGSTAAAWAFAILTLSSPFYIQVSRTGWGRLTWTPLLVLLLLLSQWKAMRGRGAWWSAAFVLLAGAVSMTDGLVLLPLVLVLALYACGGSLAQRLRQVSRDRVFWAALAAMSLGFAIDLAVGLTAYLRGTSLTLVAYILFKGSHARLIPSLHVLVETARSIDKYLPFRGGWLAVAVACGLAVRDGLRGRPIGVVAVWWLLAVLGTLRYNSGLEIDAMTTHQAYNGAGWLNASILAVPSLLLLAWLIGIVVEGASRAGGAVAIALLLGMVAANVPLANRVAFEAMPSSSSCRAIKGAALYVRSHSTTVPYVFHLTSNTLLGFSGEYYYGLSFGRSVRPEEPNHLLDFGAPFGTEHEPRAFYRPYGVSHFDYYVQFADHPSPLVDQVRAQLLRDGARVVNTIVDEGRVIGEVLSFGGEPATEIEYRTAAREWDRRFAHPRTLLQQALAGTAYHFGYNWLPPEQGP